MVTFNLFEMNPVQLAALYKFLIAMYRTVAADAVYEAAVANCGAHDFCELVAKA